MKRYAVKINAGNDANGNPRRAWLVYDRNGNYLGTVDEGYSGDAELKRQYPGAVVLAVVPTTVKFYREALQ
jgi:hypothetical protein